MSQSYSNPGGQGDRTASIDVITSFAGPQPIPNFVNGTIIEFEFFVSGTPSVVGQWFEFDHSAIGSRQITEVKWKIGDDRPQGTWSWQGWDGASWVDIDTGIVLGAGAESPSGVFTTTIPVSGGFFEKHRFFGTADNFANAWLFEVEFEISDIGPPTDHELEASMADGDGMAVALTTGSELSASFTDGAEMAATLTVQKLQAFFTDEATMEVALLVQQIPRMPITVVVSNF